MFWPATENRWWLEIDTLSWNAAGPGHDHTGTGDVCWKFDKSFRPLFRRTAASYPSGLKLFSPKPRDRASIPSRYIPGSRFTKPSPLGPRPPPPSRVRGIASGIRASYPNNPGRTIIVVASRTDDVLSPARRPRGIIEITRFPPRGGVHDTCPGISCIQDTYRRPRGCFSDPGHIIAGFSSALPPPSGRRTSFVRV